MTNYDWAGGKVCNGFGWDKDMNGVVYWTKGMCCGGVSREAKEYMNIHREIPVEVLKLGCSQIEHIDC